MLKRHRDSSSMLLEHMIDRTASQQAIMAGKENVSRREVKVERLVGLLWRTRTALTILNNYCYKYPAHLTDYLN